MDLLRLFSDNLLPVLLVAAAGWLVAATLRPDPRPLALVAFNVLAPCLVFQVIVESRLPAAALARLGAFAAVSLLALGALAFAVARALGWSRTRTSAVVLCAMLPNAGNYGMSANLLAFGDDGLTYAGVYFVTSAVITFTVGVLVASLGRASAAVALRGLLRVPAIWGVVAAALVQWTGFTVPRPAASAVGMMADACIPAFLVILGMQLHGVRLAGPALPLAVAGSLRLAGGAALGLALAPWFGLEGAARQAGVFQSAMPTAVITTILATEYDVEPALVTSVVLLTTLASPFLLTPLLALLMRG